MGIITNIDTGTMIWPNEQMFYSGYKNAMLTEAAHEKRTKTRCA